VLFARPNAPLENADAAEEVAERLVVPQEDSLADSERLTEPLVEPEEVELLRSLRSTDVVLWL